MRYDNTVKVHRPLINSIFRFDTWNNNLYMLQKEETKIQLTISLLMPTSELRLLFLSQFMKIEILEIYSCEILIQNSMLTYKFVSCICLCFCLHYNIKIKTNYDRLSLIVNNSTILTLLDAYLKLLVSGYGHRGYIFPFIFNLGFPPSGAKFFDIML